MKSSKTIRPFSVSLFALVLILTGSQVAAQTTSDGANAAQTSVVPSRITQPIDDSVRVTIAHSTHPFVQVAADLGPLDSGTPLNRMILVLGVSDEVERDLRTTLDSQQTEGSPNYHQWLTPEAFGQRFGPSPQDIQQVTAWLQKQGFTVNQVAKSGRVIEFSGTVAQVQTAFQTQMRHYQVDGAQHVANASDISIPAALAPVVRGIASLHNFYSRPMLTQLIRARRNPDGTYSSLPPDLTFSDGSHAIGPGDFATIYNLNPLYTATPIAINGTNETIALVAVSNINQISTTGVDDVANFRQLFGLPTNPPNIILDGPDPGIDFTGGAGAEATLDTEWAGSVAPNATIDLVVSAATLVSDPVILSSEFIVNGNLAPIMSSSFGACEANLGTAGNAFWNGLWEQAAAQGISVFVASGDTGAAGCDPNMPSASLPTNTGANTLAISGFASTPFDTAVGGTEFNETIGGGTNATFWNTTVFNGTPATATTAKGYLPEMVWNDSCDPTKTPTACNLFFFFSGGGGVSTVYGKPSYQSLSITGVPNDSARDIPDVSLAASNQHDPYVLCFSSDPTQPDCNGTISLAGGTSFSSPEFAGIMALVDQKTGGRQGLANYVLYSLAKTESPQFSTCNSSSRTNPATASPSQCVFNDVTVGNNTVPGLPNPGGFNATAGYDLATGLGTVDATKLITAWGAASAAFQGSVTTLSASGTGVSGTTITTTHGAPINFTVTVAKMTGSSTTAVPTGNVALVAAPGGTTPPSIPTVGAIGPLNSSGSVTTTTSTTPLLPGGKYSLIANYPGDGTFGSSTSNTFQINITAEPSIVLMAGFTPASTSGMNTISLTYGSPLAVDVLVGGSAATENTNTPTNSTSAATGTVTFTDTIGSAAATNLTSAIPLNADGGAEVGSCLGGSVCLSGGVTHMVNANYSGDTSYAAGNTTQTTPPNTVAVTVTAASTSTSVMAIPTSGVTTATSVMLTATIATTSGGNGPTGTVAFTVNGTTLGTAPVTGTAASGQAAAFGTATLPHTFTTPNTYAVSASYTTGDGNYTSSASSGGGNATVTVGSVGNFTVAGSATSATAGNSAMSTITVTPSGGFTGMVTVNCPATSALPPGVTCTPPSAPLNVTGTAAVTGTLSLAVAAPSSSMTASNIQTERTYVAQAATPQTGNKGAWFTLSGGTGLAAVLLLFLPGRKRIRAALGLGLVCLLSFALGCGGGGGGTTLTQTTTTITVSSTKVAQNGMLTVSAMVTGGTPTGTVQFVVDGTAAGNPVMLTNGSTGNITVTVTNTVGTHTLSAQYAGSSTTMASHSGTLNVTVTGTTQIAITATATGSATVNGNVSLTIN